MEEKKRKDQEAKENAAKEEKARMVQMIEASGRQDPGAIADNVGDKDPGATADRVGDGVGAVTPTETPSKRRRLQGKQAVRDIASPTNPREVTPPIPPSGSVEMATKPRQSFKPPSYCVERSRSQVLFRTGLRGSGQSTAIPYGVGQIYADEHAAQAVAREWVILEKKKRGLPIKSAHR